MVLKYLDSFTPEQLGLLQDVAALEKARMTSKVEKLNKLKNSSGTLDESASLTCSTRDNTSTSMACNRATLLTSDSHGSCTCLICA